jgi:hypothetical protein
MQGLFAAAFDWERVARVEGYGAAKHSKGDPALSLGFLMLVAPRRHIYESLLRLEGDRAAIRKKLSETP